MLGFFIRRKLLVGSIVVIALLIGIGVTLRGNGDTATTSPIEGNLIRSVKIAGKVTPSQSVSLGFETAGTVSSISKAVGDQVRAGEVIARLDAGAVLTNVEKARAELALAEAELAKLSGVGTYEAQIDNAKRALIQTIFDAYTAADDAVRNKTDQVFIDPRDSSPEMIYAFGTHFDLRDKVIKTRSTLDETLDDWQALIAGLNVDNFTDNHLTLSKNYLSQITTYITNIAQAVNLFEASGSLTQANIDDYKADALTARDNINSANQNLISKEDTYRNLLSDVPVQVARVEAARATLGNYQSQSAKTVLTSPIAGIVSRQDAKIGQVVSATTDLVSVISNGLEIEAFIPEVLISGVKVGNSASVTLDAYGTNEIFDARVIHLDPAETIRDGVSTYKVRLAFTTPDERIRPGMTANINIETFRKDDVVLIPERAVVRTSDGVFIQILSGKHPERVMVEVGERDSNGQVELITPLSSDTRIIINPEDIE